MTFKLDARLEHDSRPVLSLPLCECRLINDGRVSAWLLLIPRRAASEIFDLSSTDQTLLMHEISETARVLKSLYKADKLNIAAIGNKVSQLHIHVIVRHKTDALWPETLWGHGQAQAEPEATLLKKIDTLRQALSKFTVD